ncbi:hypothetical protein BpHYR1_021961 [Brachionus plicatilis]|uniref:Uncharacterized protein n=1 Tax=Brachionus plicatilis TaxID=10195 RepID=A0A3M7QPA3_BRAPC|nr:hypothetical protein BpHYR1_021961 [Brachionus plicatilis]
MILTKKIGIQEAKIIISPVINLKKSIIPGPLIVEYTNELIILPIKLETMTKLHSKQVISKLAGSQVLINDDLLQCIILFVVMNLTKHYSFFIQITPIMSSFR